MKFNRRLVVFAALAAAVPLLTLAAPGASAAPAHTSASAAHARAASSSTEKYYRTVAVATSSTLLECQADQLLYPRGAPYDGGIIVASNCFYVVNGLYELLVTVEYNGPDPLVQVNDACSGAFDAPGYAACEGMWEASSAVGAQVFTQNSGNHSITHLTWVPYPNDPTGTWGWLEDPGGRVLAYSSGCGCSTMYTKENVWWELYKQVTAPSYAGWWHVPISLDSHNNGTLGACVHYWGDAQVVGYETNQTTCYSTIPQEDTWAAPYN